MRPIELMPEEERRSRLGTLRTGPLPFIIVGALVALLAGVVMLALTSNQISDRKSEIVRLEGEKATAIARADELQPYSEFQQLKDQRTSTVANLADSRFDWVRTIRQLSLVIPGDVWLIKLEASAAQGAASGGEASSSTAASSIAGPSVTMEGCALGQDSVAAFVAALKQIDGVTRVGLSESFENEEEGGGEPSESEGGGESSQEGGCGGNRFQFKLVIAFDAAPPSADSSTTTAAPETPAPTESPAE